MHKKQTSLSQKNRARCLIIAFLALLGLSSSGLSQVQAWGDNSSGVCNIPENALSDVTAIATSSYSYHCIALKNGACFSWGENYNGTLNVPESALSGVTAIACGTNYNLAVKSDGSVIAWGSSSSSSNCLGTDSSGNPIINHYATGQQVQILGTPLMGIKTIACGWLHSIALTLDGAVVAWGGNDRGQCNVPENALSGVTAIACGTRYTLALKNGEVLAWGDNYYGVCNVPEIALTEVTAIAAAKQYAVVLKNGQVFGWGDNTWGGCLGSDIDGNAIDSIPSSQPVQINGIPLTDVKAIACGTNHSIALINGEVKTWGSPCFMFRDSCEVPLNARSSGLAIAGGNYSTFVLLNSLCRSDLDGSGYVDSADISSILLEFGGPKIGKSACDLDGNNYVDSGDLSIVLLESGSCSESMTTEYQSEPSTLQLAEPANALPNKK